MPRETVSSQITVINRIAAHPCRVALVAIAGYAALALPILILRHMDLSAFVMAGDRFVDAAQTASPIFIRHNSDGYDGQFFYRLVMSPFSLAQSVHGVAFDWPAKRMQRIVFPLIGWVLSLGNPAAASGALFGANLAGIGAIAALSATIARRASLPLLVPVAIVFWPGFLVSLTRDTAEIASAAFLLGAILCRLSGRLTLYAALGAVATLSRETMLPVFAGFLIWDAITAWNSRARTAVAPLAASLVLLLPFAIWHEALAWLWRGAPQQPLDDVIGLPFAGLATMLSDCLTGARRWASTPTKDFAVRGIVLVTSLGLVTFSVLVALRLRSALRGGGKLAPLAVSWLLTACLMALLTAGGPWVDPAAYMRAFSECYVTGCLVLGAGGVSLPARPALLAMAAMLIPVWIFCVAQTGFGTGSG